MNARSVAVEALRRIDDGAYANLVMPGLLAHSGLDDRDRRFVTELVYGTTRMRRACDFLVDRFVLRSLDVPTRRVLRLGAFQLQFLDTPAHAAVAETVAVAPRRSRGLVNAVLRRVAESPVAWPDEPTRLSYPDWVVDRLVADLGADEAVAALEQMDRPAEAVARPDGYVQDPASAAVVTALGALPGERVADICAAPGGKATGLAGTGAWVAAADLRPRRVGLVKQNAARTGAAQRVAVVTADGRCPPWRPGAFDRVLVDAPCSGLGVLRRRPDARWRIQADDVGRLAALQRELLAAALDLVRPGGLLAYSVCTMTAEETSGIDAWLGEAHPTWEPVDPPGAPWRSWGRGALLQPQDAGTDGMFLLLLRRPA